MTRVFILLNFLAFVIASGVDLLSTWRQIMTGISFIRSVAFDLLSFAIKQTKIEQIPVPNVKSRQ
jgi:hypothetical protein